MKSDNPDLACQRVVEMVTDYLEGALPADAGCQLEQHLLICEACCVFVDQHRAVAQALSHMSEPPASTALESSKNAALAAFRKLRKPEAP